MAGLSEARDRGVTSSLSGSLRSVLSLTPCAAVRDGCLCFLEWRVWWEQGGAEAGIGPDWGRVFVQRKDLEGLEVPARTGKGLYLSCLWVNPSGFSGQRCSTPPPTPAFPLPHSCPGLNIFPSNVPRPRSWGRGLVSAMLDACPRNRIRESERGQGH